MPLFFISYKREDIDFALDVKRFIEAQRGKEYLAWIDREGINAGDNWKNVIDTAIKQSIGLIVILTPEAITSPYVTYEWSYAMGLGKRVIPLILRRPSPEQMDIHAKLTDLHMLMFDSKDESRHEWDALERELEQLKLLFDVPLAVQNMKLALYNNMFDDDYKRNIIKTLQDYEHVAANEILAEFIESALWDVRMMASIALAHKSNFQDLRALKGLAELLDKYGHLQESAFHNGSRFDYELISRFPAEEALAVFEAFLNSINDILEKKEHVWQNTHYVFDAIAMIKHERALELYRQYIISLRDFPTNFQNHTNVITIIRKHGDIGLQIIIDLAQNMAAKKRVSQKDKSDYIMSLYYTLVEWTDDVNAIPKKPFTTESLEKTLKQVLSIKEML